MGGSANRPRIVQFWNLWTISYTKSKFKGGPFYEKNCQLMYLRPHFGGRFEKWGVCQSALNWPIWKFFNIFLHKIRIERGSVLWKKLPTHVFGALQCGPFWTNGGVGQSAKIWPILTFKNIFLYKIEIQRGYLLRKNLPSHVIRAPCGGPFWSNAWLPTGQIWADQFFLIILNLKSKISLGHTYEKSWYGPK